MTFCRHKNKHAFLGVPNPKGYHKDFFQIATYNMQKSSREESIDALSKYFKKNPIMKPDVLLLQEMVVFTPNITHRKSEVYSKTLLYICSLRIQDLKKDRKDP